LINVQIKLTCDGTNKLTTVENMKDDINRILEGKNKPGEIPELWDGRTSERILKILVDPK